jgi:tape measure domain-containing protein
MARDVESLVLQMTADLRRFDKSMAAMKATADKRLNEVERRALQSDRNLSRIMGRAGQNITASFRDSLRGLAPSLAAAFSAGAVIKYADAYTGLKNSLAAAGLEGARLTAVENGLYDAANRNGVAVAATAQLFQRASLARDRLRASDEQLLQLVSGTTAALKLQGTSAEAASGPLLQLGQAISGNVVQAEEYNSLIDGLPVLLQAAAAGSTRFGGDVAKLTEQVKAGKVSSKEFFDAILAGLPAIEERASKAQTTVSAALQTLNNELGRFVGQTDQGLSATQRMAQGIVFLSENLDVLVTASGVAVTIVGGRFVVAQVAATAATVAHTRAQIALLAAIAGTSQGALVGTVALRGLGAAALFFVTNPIGIAITAVAAALALLALRGQEGSAAMRQVDASAAEASTALDEYERAMMDASAAAGEARTTALANAAAMRQAAVDAIAEAKANYELARSRRVAAAAADREAAARSFRSVDGGKGAADASTAASAAARSRYARAVEEEKAAEEAYKGAETRLGRIEAGAGRAAPVGAAAAPSRRSAGQADDAARQQSRRDELDLERQIAAARAKGDESAVKALEERRRLAQLVASYEDAGFADARGKALEHLSYETEAVALAERREIAERVISALADGTAEAAQALAIAQERASDAALDRLALEVQIARLSGDVTLPALERELYIQERIADLQRQNPNLSGGAARGQAEGEADALRAANIIGGLGSADPDGDAVAARQAAYEEIERLRQADRLSDQQAAQARAQADADYWERRTEHARSGLDALAGLQNSSNKRLAQIGKAAAVAQATIDGVLAIQKAWASAPYPFNLPAVAITTASTAANIATIAGMKDGGLVTGPGGPRDDKVLRRLSAGEFVVNARSTRENRALLEAVNNGQVPRMAGGGMVGRVNAAAARVPDLAASRTSNQTFSSTIDARGADLGVERRIRAALAERDAALAGQVRGVMARTEKYALGRRRK